MTRIRRNFSPIPQPLSWWGNNGSASAAGVPGPASPLKETLMALESRPSADQATALQHIADGGAVVY